MQQATDFSAVSLLAFSFRSCPSYFDPFLSDHRDCYALRTLGHVLRVERLIHSAIEMLSLDLDGISVLTETGSGPFVVTPLIAALAGAERVVAVTRDSRYGKACEVRAYTEVWAEKLGVRDRIEVSTEAARSFAPSANVVTNLGFVRPINAEFIDRLPSDAAVALMWETWEFREQDLDLNACRNRGIPVLGTCETDPRLQIFRYVGMLSLKLLLEAHIEVFKSRIVVVGSGHFGAETQGVLVANGAHVLQLDPTGASWNPQGPDIRSFVQTADAIVVVEHACRSSVLGGAMGIPLDWIAAVGVPVIHICGKIDEDGVGQLGIHKHPAGRVRPGYMALTTDYVGPRPVIDLHAAGLKVGEALVRGLRLYRDPNRAVRYALENSPAMNFE